MLLVNVWLPICIASAQVFVRYVESETVYIKGWRGLIGRISGLGLSSRVFITCGGWALQDVGVEGAPDELLVFLLTLFF